MQLSKVSEISISSERLEYLRRQSNIETARDRETCLFGNIDLSVRILKDAQPIYMIFSTLNKSAPTLISDNWLR